MDAYETPSRSSQSPISTMKKKYIYAFTSAACNYLPKVRLLVKSLRRFHPEVRVVLTMADEVANSELLSTEDWDEILPISALGIENWRQWAFTHEIVELSTAIKPFALANLLSRDDCKAVIYLDPDMVLFSRLDDLISEFESHDILLTPHQTTPETRLAEIMDNEICSLKHGIYNLGFIGVRSTENGKAFAQWWSDRAYYFCRDEISNGLFTDQRWIDLVPAFFDRIKILRSPRFNVAPWNISTRKLSGNIKDGFSIENIPLGFYHFTGFDSGAHCLVTAKYEKNNPALSHLTNWYKGQISSLGNDPLSQQNWAFGYFEDGTPITRYQRLIYRNRPDLQRKFPSPFLGSSSDSNSFLGWSQQIGFNEYPNISGARKSKDIDYSELTMRLTPSIAPPTDEADSISKQLASALSNPLEAKLIAKQAIRVIRREGFFGFISRLKNKLFRK